MSPDGPRSPRARREEAAAAVLVGRAQPLGRGPILCAGDEIGVVASAFRRAGAEVVGWCRRAGGGEAATPWPPEGRFAAASLSLPQGRRALEMSLHAVASRLEADARVWVYGSNDAGIRSAGTVLRELFRDVRTLDARRHARVWEGFGRRADQPLRARLVDWKGPFQVTLFGAPVELVTYPGVFAHGRLDEGSRELLAALPRLRPGIRVLDFGCGAGVIARAVRVRCPDAELDLVDVDALAVEAARENVPGARVHLGDGWSGLDPGQRFDLVLSNPPFHRGKQLDFTVVAGLVDGAARRLGRRGRLLLVAPRGMPCARWLGSGFDAVEVLRESRRFRVWSAGRHPGAEGRGSRGRARRARGR